jgi:hypothetical protein
VKELAAHLNLPTFKTYEFKSLDELIEASKTLSVLDEGFVLKYPGDLLVKVKGPAYLAAHRFISQLSDKNILEAVAEGTAKDLAQLAPEEYRQDVLDKIDYYNKRIANLTEMCYTKYAEAPKESRKIFALWVNSNVEQSLRGFLFQLLDGKEVNRQQMCKVLAEIENVSGATKI